MNKFICFKCGYDWIPRLEKPIECPRCHSRLWNEKGFSVCKICKRNFLLLHIHHKDGNPHNNNENNLLKVCEDCHSFIHGGITKQINKRARTRRYFKKPELIKELLKLREYWLKNKKPKDI